MKRVTAFLNNPATKSATGRAHLVKYSKGGTLTQRQAIHANCYDCMGGYSDGKHSCRIPSCALFPWMPYKDTDR